MSEISTTVAAHSLNNRAVYRIPSLGIGHNFAELGAGLVNDTPNSKRSIEFKSAYRRREKNSTLIKGSTKQPSKTNLAVSESTKRRKSLFQSESRQQIRHNRASSRNLQKYGGLGHFSFI